MTVASPEPANRFHAPEAVNRLQMIGLAVGVVAAVLCGVGYATDADQFFYSWLLGCTLWLGLSIGGLALSMIQHLTGGGWGVVARRIFEASAGVLPLMLLLFLPLLAGLEVLYPWARESVADPLLAELIAHKRPYLNVDFFVGRFFAYFVLWIGMAFWLRRLSLRQDRDRDGAADLSARMAKISAPGLVVWAFVTTFAYFDWLMSLEPYWFSTIYGVYFFGGSGLATLAFLILVAGFLRRFEPMSWALQTKHFHDWGKLLFAFVMLWAYFGFSQFLIIWSANLPEEIEWYLHRTEHGWGIIAITLVLIHFAIPFALLLSRDLKRHAGRLAVIAGFLLVARWMDVLWQIAPAHHPKQLAIHWMDLAAPLAVGGLWLAAFVWNLKRHPILPVHDPYIEEAVDHE